LHCERNLPQLEPETLMGSWPMDRDHQTNGDQKPRSLEQPWWLGTAKRQRVLVKFIIICIVIALLIVGVVMALHP
jgi:hypothetical protein